eukprot:5831203-Pyramimonas_sp.AAC.3
MNPMVKIEAIQGPIEAMPTEVFKLFDVIVSSGVSLDAQVSLKTPPCPKLVFVTMEFKAHRGPPALNVKRAYPRTCRKG